MALHPSTLVLAALPPNSQRSVLPLFTQYTPGKLVKEHKHHSQSGSALHVEQVLISGHGFFESLPLALTSSRRQRATTSTAMVRARADRWVGISMTAYGSRAGLCQLGRGLPSDAP
jgi:hypothetical protein